LRGSTSTAITRAPTSGDLHDVQAETTAAVDDDGLTRLDARAPRDAVERRGHRVGDHARVLYRNLWRDAIGVAGGRHDVVREPAVDRVAEHALSRADVLPAGAAGVALAAGRDGGQQDRLADERRIDARAGLRDRPGDLVAEHQGWRLERRHVVVEVVQVAVAEPARDDLDEDLASPGLRPRDRPMDQRLPRPEEHGSTHRPRDLVRRRVPHRCDA
jgi:hypothetical protein